MALSWKMHNCQFPQPHGRVPWTEAYPVISLLSLVEEQLRYFCFNRNSELSFEFVRSISNNYSSSGKEGQVHHHALIIVLLSVILCFLEDRLC